MENSAVPQPAGRRGVAVPLVALIAALVVSGAFSSSPVHAAAPLPVRHVAPAATRASLPPTTLEQAPAGLRAAVRATVGQPSLSTGPLQKAKLVAGDAASDDLLGFAVAISGTTALVGAYGKNSNTGAAYVFVRSGSSWSQQAKLTASDGAGGDYFGYSVAVLGSTAVVGAFGKSSSTGAAYVFTRSGTVWSQRAELSNPDDAINDNFGRSVAISSLNVVVGADGLISDSGAVFFYNGSGASWALQGSIFGNTAGTRFGFSVATSGSTTIVGAFATNSNTGAAYVYVRSGSGWSVQAALTASDAAFSDEFGASVAIAGAYAVVGALGKNSNAGAAYVFVRSGTTWAQQAKLTGIGAAGDYFGASVAVAGSNATTTAVVGSFGTSSNLGAAYVFARSGTSWPLSAFLTAGDGAGGDHLGYSVAMSGSTVLAGAPYKNSAAGAAYVFAMPYQQAEVSAAGTSLFGDAVAISGTTAVVGAWGTNNKGAAYVFVRSGTTWSQQAQLTPTGGLVAGDNFGISVAISGSTAAVGADQSNGSGPGAVYVFVRSGTAWTQQAELTNGDTTGDQFGHAVAITGSTILVGAPYADSNLGLAYVYVRSGTSWSFQSTLGAPGQTMDDLFGYSVALSNSSTPLRAVVGEYLGNSNLGAAYVYHRSGTSWLRDAELTAGDGVFGDSFGVSVAISNSTAVVGAYLRNGGSGSAYVFVRAGTSWSLQAELAASDATANGYFGLSVALSGATALIGAIRGGGGDGAVYEFRQSGPSWSQQAELTAADATAGAEFGYSVAIFGTTAVVGAVSKNSSAGAAYMWVLP